MKTLFLMVGISGSGKTIFSEKLAKGLSLPRFSSDEIRTELCNGDTTDQSKNSLVFKTLFQRVQNALSKSNVIVDATNVKIRDRKEFYKIALKCHAQVIALIMSGLSVEECIQFNNKRERKVPQDIINRQQNNLVVPTLNEVSEILYVNWKDDIIMKHIPNKFHFQYYTTKELIKFYDITKEV